MTRPPPRAGSTDGPKPVAPFADGPAFLQLVLDSSTEYSIIAADLEGRILLWNEGARRIYGYDAEEIVGKHVRLLRDPSSLEREGGTQDILRVAIQQGKWEGLIVRRRRNGETFPARVVETVLRDPTGEPIGFLMISQDLSEDERLHQQLVASEEYNRGLIEANVDALMTTDLQGTITDANRRVEELTGRPWTQLIGTPLKDCFSDPARAEEAIRRVLVEHRLTNFEAALRAADGRAVTVAFNAATFRGRDDRVRGVIATARDVSEQKRLRQELEERNAELLVQNQRVQEATRHKSEFLAIMSHELRAPLNSIIGFSDFLLSQPGANPDPAWREYMEDILKGGHHLLQLINDVLDLAKVESGRLELNPEPFSPRAAVEEVCSVVRPLAREKGVHLTAETAPELESVVLDPLRFRQILYNLLSNAVKFTPTEGRVDLRIVRQGGHHLALTVEDTGIGISADDLPRLFREFQQLDAGPGRRYEGSGLGLSLTKRLVELQGGSIGVVSEVGKGTVFTVILPEALDAELSGSASAPIPPVATRPVGTSAEAAFRRTAGGTSGSSRTTG
jgi:PAS domain S-box-containing protein